MFARAAALACTVRVAGLAELTEKLPLVTPADSQLTSLTTPTILIALALVVDRMTFCDVAPCPDDALNARLEGFAVSVPPPPVPPGAYVTVTVTGVPPVGVNAIVAEQVPQLVFESWKDKVSGVWRLLALKVLSQKGTPERVYVKAVVPDDDTWIDRAWLSFRATVVELTINCCARPGTASSSAVARNKAVFVSSLRSASMMLFLGQIDDTTLVPGNNRLRPLL